MRLSILPIQNAVDSLLATLLTPLLSECSHSLQCLFFQLPYAALIAVLIGVTNIIPFFGPFIGAIPSAVILFLESPWDMIIFIAIVFVIQQLDGNLFKPKIIGSQVGLSSFWVLFSVIVGGSLFGMVGFIFRYSYICGYLYAYRQKS